MPEPLDDIDRLLGLAERLVALDKHRLNVTLSVRSGDPNCAAFERIERYLRVEARKMARSIAGALQ
jgi:hypothetical protein